MTSSKRSIASRKIGALSGADHAGTIHSSANSPGHHVPSTAVILSGESREEFDILRNQYFSHFDPADRVEHCVVEEMAATNWRMRRLHAIQTYLVAQSAASTTEPGQINRIADSFNDVSQRRKLYQLQRYEARLSSRYQCALQILSALAQLPKCQTNLDSNNDNALSSLDPTSGSQL